MEERIIKDINNLLTQLFSKMKEAGYEWNAEHKQLKKIESKSAWSEEDEKKSRFIGNAITADDASEYLGSKGIQVIDAHVWLEKLKERVQPQPKQEWSEEDEKILQWIITDIKRLINDNKKANVVANKELDWLITIKQRIGE